MVITVEEEEVATFFLEDLSCIVCDDDDRAADLDCSLWDKEVDDEDDVIE